MLAFVGLMVYVMQGTHKKRKQLHQGIQSSIFVQWDQALWRRCLQAEVESAPPYMDHPSKGLIRGGCQTGSGQYHIRGVFVANCFFVGFGEEINPFLSKKNNHGVSTMKLCSFHIFWLVWEMKIQFVQILPPKKKSHKNGQTYCNAYFLKVVWVLGTLVSLQSSQ